MTSDIKFKYISFSGHAVERSLRDFPLGKVNVLSEDISSTDVMNVVFSKKVASEALTAAIDRYKEYKADSRRSYNFEKHPLQAIGVAAVERVYVAPLLGPMFKEEGIVPVNKISNPTLDKPWKLQVIFDKEQFPLVTEIKGSPLEIVSSNPMEEKASVNLPKNYDSQDRLDWTLYLTESQLPHKIELNYNGVKGVVRFNENDPFYIDEIFFDGKTQGNSNEKVPFLKVKNSAALEQAIPFQVLSNVVAQIYAVHPDYEPPKKEFGNYWGHLNKQYLRDYASGSSDQTKTTVTLSKGKAIPNGIQRSMV